MEQTAQRVEASVAKLNEITDQLKDEDLNSEEAVELLKQCSQLAADALEQLEALARELEKGA